MDRFDLVVVGAGSGEDVAVAAAERGWTTALVDDGPLGGTCLNRGCIPSKMLLHSADVVETIDSAPKFGIDPKGWKLRFSDLVTRVSEYVDGESQGIEHGIASLQGLTRLREHVRFTGPRQLRTASGREIEGERILVAAGCRPKIPSLPGLDRVPFLTSKEALRLDVLPRHLIVLGGGYIACELGHFFRTLGAEVTIVHRHPTLLPREDGEVARLFTQEFAKRVAVRLESEATTVDGKAGAVRLLYRPKGGAEQELRGSRLLVAVGITPNTDRLGVARAGLELDDRGYLRVNDFLETNVPKVWGFGDIIGRYPYKHAANWEAAYLIRKFFGHRHEGEAPSPVDYTAMPHAIFTSPQVAGVGATEEELRTKGTKYRVGREPYYSTGMGRAIEAEVGFAKVLVEDAPPFRILGAHIVGPDASTLLHEVVVAMKAGTGSVTNLTQAVHVHPALSEVVQRAAARA